MTGAGITSRTVNDKNDVIVKILCGIAKTFSSIEVGGTDGNFYCKLCIGSIALYVMQAVRAITKILLQYKHTLYNR